MLTYMTYKIVHSSSIVMASQKTAYGSAISGSAIKPNPKLMLISLYIPLLSSAEFKKSSIKSS